MTGWQTSAWGDDEPLDDAPEPARAVASHHGTCPVCSTPIRPGQVIVLDRDEHGWTHGECPPDAVSPSQLELLPGETVCTSCWLVHRGECA